MIDDRGLLLNPADNVRTQAGSRPSIGDPHDSGRGRLRSGRDRDRRPLESVLPAAYDLLSAVLSDQPADALAVVQFFPLSGHDAVRLVPAAFAAASAAAFGRTLLLDVSCAADGSRRQHLGSAPADANPMTLRRTMTPDMARPGLHYAGANPRCVADLSDLNAKVARATAAQASPFRMVVLDQAVPLAREHALMLSTGCTATIPVAIAGESRLPQMREALRRLRAAGATLTGLVLIHPPRDRQLGDISRQIVPRC